MPPLIPPRDRRARPKFLLERRRAAEISASMSTTPEAPDHIEPIQSLEQTITDEDQTPVIVENLNEQPPIKEERLPSNISQDPSAVDMSRDSPSQLDSLSGMYNGNHSVIYHTGYGYSQMQYGPYSSVRTPLPSDSGDGQLYSPQHFPFSGGFFLQPATLSINISVGMPVGQQLPLLSNNSNSYNVPFGPRPSYQPYHGQFGVGRDGTGAVTSSPRPIGKLVSFGQSSMPLASGMVSQQQRYGFGTGFR